MYLIVALVVTVLASSISPPAAPSDTSSTELALPPSARDLTREEATFAIQLLYDNQLGAATAYLDSLSAICGGEPFYMLTRARVMRERLPIDDDDKDIVAEMAAPIHEQLQRVVDVCSERIDKGDKDPSLRLYRGWARMFQSHVHTLERRFWAAGRAAKKGRGDLDRYRKLSPDDPAAAGIMGTFLYFADQLSVVTKFISKLFLMPSGDREEGLRLMEDASRQISAPLDNRLLLYSIYLLFEGRYEDGLKGFDGMLEKHPNYMGLTRSFALMAPFAPASAHEFSMRVSGVMDEMDRLDPAEVDPSSYVVLRFLRAYAFVFYDPERAVAELETIVDLGPKHPDWVGGYAAFELGRLKAARGETDDARELFEWVLSTPRSRYIWSDANEALDALKSTQPAPLLLHPATVARIYRGDHEACDRAIEAITAVEDPATRDRFYLAEALLLSGRANEAIAVYEALLDDDSPVWDNGFRMIAASRAAEIHGANGEYELAAKRLDDAMHFYRREFLTDWILEGRHRYYERLKDGKESVLPTLFSSIQ